MESLFVARIQAPRLWSGSADSTILDYQRTLNPSEYQIVITLTNSTQVYKNWHHPTASSTLCRIPHPKNKEGKNTKPIFNRQHYYLNQPCPSEEKKKLTCSPWNAGTSQTLHEAYINHWINIMMKKKKNQKEERILPWSLRKGGLKHNKLKK